MTIILIFCPFAYGRSHELEGGWTLKNMKPSRNTDYNAGNIRLETDSTCEESVWKKGRYSEGDQPWDFFGGNDAEALQYFGHLMRRADSLEKTLMLGGIGDRRRRG